MAKRPPYTPPRRVTSSGLFDGSRAMAEPHCEIIPHLGITAVGRQLVLLGLDTALLSTDWDFPVAGKTAVVRRYTDGK